jgi:hypothetical protein
MDGRPDEGLIDAMLRISWIKDFLPGRESHVGGTAEDNRLFVDSRVG